MSYYTKKRIRSGLSQSDIANELGIETNKYILVERGEINMPANLIDRFNKVVNRGINENKLIKLEREKAVNEWFKEMSTIKNGKPKIYEKMAEFNIDTFRELTPLIGYKDSSVFSQFFKTNPQKASYEFKNRVYTFFENELNMQPKKKTTKRGRTPRQRKTTNLYNWYKSINLNEYMKENDLTGSEMSQATGISTTQINRLRNNLMIPREDTIKKLKKFFDKYEKTEESIITSKDIITTNIIVEDVNRKPLEHMSYKEKLISKYTNLLNFNYKKIDEVNRQIKKLQEELIALTKEKTIYEDVLIDIKEEN